MTDATTPQPQPTRGRDEVLGYVIEDLKIRSEKGKAHYGTPLMTFNGRDALQDLYEEILDAAVYAKQAILERDAAHEKARHAEMQRLIKELAR